MTDESTGEFDDGNGFRAVAEHLLARRLITDPNVTVTRLSGGVSNDVLAVEGVGVHLVVKRALSRLRVAEEWFADPGRILIEAAALEIASAIQPDHVPPVLDVDEHKRIVVLGFAENAHEWKSDLLDGHADVEVGKLLGRVLARWHADTRHSPDIRNQFGSLDAFDQLRVEPFYQFTAERHPDVADVISATSDRMLESRRCLVHGDFSPKNILLGSTSTWVIDWEVAHYGDPVFDIAFLVTHLMCKALHRPNHAEGFRRVAEAFLTSYRVVERDSDAHWDELYLTSHIACLLLARIDGKSPVPYLDEPARIRGRSLALGFLSQSDLSLFHMWKALT